MVHNTNQFIFDGSVLQESIIYYYRYSIEELQLAPIIKHSIIDLGLGKISSHEREKTLHY